MQPVDRPAIGRIDRPGAAQHQDRHLVAPGVVEGHHRVLQPDQVVQNDQARLAGDLAVALRHVQRHFLGAAQDDLRPGIAGVVDQRVVQPAEARTRRQHHVLEAHRLDQVADHIRAVLGIHPVARQVDRCLGLKVRPSLIHRLCSFLAPVRCGQCGHPGPGCQAPVRAIGYGRPVTASIAARSASVIRHAAARALRTACSGVRAPAMTLETPGRSASQEMARSSRS